MPPLRVGRQPEPLHIEILALTCSRLHEEVNQYLGMEKAMWVEDRTKTTVHISYPLGLIATHAALPDLLQSAPRIVLSGFY
jgi:hypothetical protein